MSINKFEDWRKEKGIESLEGKSADEVAGIYNQYNHEQRKALEDAIEAKANAEQVESLRKEIMDTYGKQFDTLQEIVKTQGLEIQRVKDSGAKPKATGTIKQALEENLEALKQIKEGSRRQNVQIKAVGNMSLSGNVTGQVPQALRLPGFNEVPQRQVRFLDLLTTGSIQSNIVEWVYQANEDGAAGPTEEGAAKNKIDIDLLVGSQRVE